MKNIIFLIILSFLACKDTVTETEKELPCRSLDTPLVLDQATLKKEVYESNLSIKFGYLRLLKAKDMYLASRLALLPSINIGLALDAASSPTFLLSSVDILLPFLIPSKWFDAKQSKYQYEAQKAAIEILKLNQLASLYSLVYSAQADSKIHELLNQEIEQSILIEREVSDLVTAGQALPSDFDSSQASTLVSQAKVEAIKRLDDEAISSIKFALNLCPSSQIQLALQEVEPSEIENMTAEQAYQTVVSKNYEVSQANSLISAAKAEKWSHLFSIITGLSLSGHDSGKPFSGLEKSARAGMGPGYLVAFSLSNHNIKELELQKLEVQSELLKSLDISISSLARLQNQIDASQKSILLSERVLRDERSKFKLREVSLKQVLDRATQLRNLQSEVFRLESQYELVRVVLKRISQTL